LSESFLELISYKDGFRLQSMKLHGNISIPPELGKTLLCSSQLLIVQIHLIDSNKDLSSPVYRFQASPSVIRIDCPHGTLFSLQEVRVCLCLKSKDKVDRH